MDLLPPATAGLALDPDTIHDRYHRKFAQLSDEQIFALSARTVAVPKREFANSFTLHAPLELLARRALLEYVAPPERDAARERMLWVAATYRRAAEPVDPVAETDFASVTAAVDTLTQAIAEGDLDGVDAAAAWMSVRGAPADVVGLAPKVIDRLAAAGHASIYFHLLARVAPRSRAALALLRPLAREVARRPELRIEWIGEGVEASGADAHTLAVAIARAPRLGLPGSDFVFPIVHQVDGGIAREIVGPAIPATVAAGAQAILRVAALSMLADDPGAAPYGWTHCLTIPQAVLGVTPLLEAPALGVAIAATYVVAFRAALGTNDIDGSFDPKPTGLDVVDALAAEPGVAAAAAYHASDCDASRLVAALAARAGRQEDAHLVKYTLACFDAIAVDPGQQRLYLAAAAYLAAWWNAQARPAR